MFARTPQPSKVTPRSQPSVDRVNRRSAGNAAPDLRALQAGDQGQRTARPECRAARNPS